jgi:hypothetical protein
MAIDAPERAESVKSVSAAKAVGGRAVGSADSVLGVFDALYAQLKFYVRIVRALPRALQYRKEILVLMSDISLGSGALIVGGGMFFVVVSISFFTGTEVGLVPRARTSRGSRSVGGRRMAWAACGSVVESRGQSQAKRPT